VGTETQNPDTVNDNNSGNDTNTPPTTNNTTPLMFITGSWKGPCEQVFPVYLADTSVAYMVRYYSFGYLPSYNSETNQITSFVLYFSDDQCTTPYDFTYWPDQTEVIPDIADINISNFVFHNYTYHLTNLVVQNPVITDNSDYAMEVDFLLGGSTISNQYSSQFRYGHYYLYKNIFSITDGGSTLLFGAYDEELLYQCMAINSNELVAYYEGNFSVLDTYYGLTLLAQQTNLSFDIIEPQTYVTLQSIDSSYPYGYDPNYASYSSDIPAIFLQSIIFPQECARPTALDYSKPFTRISADEFIYAFENQ
jgi:hypothetical protein